MDTTRESLLELVRAQQETILDLQARLTRLEVAGRLATPPVEPEPVSQHPDRRQLLARAATLTAGAVAGGTALALGQATPAAAATGTFDGDPAVTATANPGSGTAISATAQTGKAIEATAQTGTAVEGTTTDEGIGVKGVATADGTGVYGTSASGIGSYAFSFNGTALVATAGGTGIRVDANVIGLDAGLGNGDSVHLRLDQNLPIPPPPTNPVARTVGMIAFDSNEDLWLCVAAGTPGTWRRLGGASTAGALTALATPVRVYDSRAGYPPAIGTKTPLSPGVARTCDLKANGSGVPAGATAVLVSLVATQTTGAAGGFLSIYRNAIAWPGTSNLNWSAPNQNVAVTTLTAVDSNAICNLYASQTTNVVVDVLGYYR